MADQKNLFTMTKSLAPSMVQKPSTMSTARKYHFHTNERCMRPQAPARTLVRLAYTRISSRGLNGPVAAFQSPSQPHQNGGASRDRTDDLKLAKLALSQLSYGPLTLCRSPPGFVCASPYGALLTQNSPLSRFGTLVRMVGPGGFEPPTPRLSSVCSNQLSYRPMRVTPKCICGTDALLRSSRRGTQRFPG